MFDKFDFSVLDDPEFKEDSVREELIQPLIRTLGYEVSGRARVIRSKSLKHPFVSIGSTKHKITIIPDYIFEIDGSIHWVLDAKSPSEEISKSCHVEQAYSYAIHPEIRSNLYALCNGKNFVLYDVRKFEPVLSFEMQNIKNHLNNLNRILNPKIRAKPEVVNYYPDYGFALTRMDVKPGFLFIAYQVHTNFFAKLQDGLYTTNTIMTDGDRVYVVSLDFNEVKFKQLLNILGRNKGTIVEKALSSQPFMMPETEEEFHFGVCAALQNEVCNNNEESYVPFKVLEFMPYKGKPQ
ncbi:MAG: type I restriction enzyme HsdR N-terminal domain-containing protein [Methylococcales bacterium]|nr:type I restriction enzyme HsdR N-terminal domain-containing protein [Methylococcales bacterium]